MCAGQRKPANFQTSGICELLRRTWPLHNRPEKSTEYSERARSSAPTVMAYADCGTYGKLDEFCAANGTPVSRGLHCYDLLTDYLVRTFNQTVLASLGLDKHPDLWPDYFAHYKRLVWLAQAPTPSLEAEVQRIASLFALPLTTIPTGLTGPEAALANLLEGFGPVSHRANRASPVSHRANSRDRVGASGVKARQR